MSKIVVTRLNWQDPVLAHVDFSGRALKVKAGFGSALSRRVDDPPGQVWALSDRGPNLKFKEAADYGWRAPAKSAELRDAKIMPCPDIGPTLARLQVSQEAVTLIETIRLKDRNGCPISGLPVPASGHAVCEPALDLKGESIAPDPGGMDTEGLAALRDGSFWASEEYGPSIVKLDAAGQVSLRLVPEGLSLDGADYPVQAILPAIAGRRQLNRGFEALAASPSETRLFLAFQSPLAHPDEAAHRHARHVRLWQMDPEGVAQAQYLYPLDPPDSFRRDEAKGEIEWSDLKLCEIVALTEECLLILERGSETTKIYRVVLDDALKLGPEHLAVETTPTVEMLSGTGSSLPELTKHLLFTSDDHPAMSADMEGMVMLDAHSLLLVSDNDFGVGEKESGFFRLEFPVPLVEVGD